MMKLSVKVKARARQEKIEKVSENSYKVWVKAAPEKGRANEEVIAALSAHLRVPKSRIEIVGGHASTNKTVEIH